MQEIFPASYREMGLWLRREVAATRGLIDRCQAELYAELAACKRLSALAASWQVWLIDWLAKLLRSPCMHLADLWTGLQILEGLPLQGPVCCCCHSRTGDQLEGRIALVGLC